MEQKVITFVALMEETLLLLIEQARDLGVSRDFHIEARTIQQLAIHPILQGSLVVLSTEIIEPMVQPYIPAGVKVIIAKRTVQYLNIRGMLEIPRGTRVLLVSDRKETAEEAVFQLNEAGMGLDFYPYYPGASYPEDIQIAVTPGEAKYVPPGIRKVVDIGPRAVDLSTWIEIYAHFRFESRNLLKVTGRFIQSLVYISKELSNEIQRASILQNYLSAIVDRIEDAVIALDHAEIIQFINHKATETLHLNGMALTGRTAAECLPADLYQLVSTLPNHEEHMLDWRGSTYFLRKMQILLEGQLFGTVILFRKADEIQKLEHDYRMRMTSNGLVAKYTFDDIHGQCSTFQKVLQIAKKVARSHSTVLLLGESGTGKELLAQAIHNASKRRKEPFVGVNFAAITESLLESELFGYEEGAFTGARKGGHIGWFEQAHKGTIFLDEIGDATWLIQNRLLRVLQERQLRRVGGTQVIPIDIRVIAATNQNLLQKVEDGTFRADLYYRLNILPIHLPPLRKRKEDIPQLAQLFITKYCAYLRRPKFTISPEGLRELLEYDWPGNIRELENVIEYLAHVVEDVMYPYHLPFFQNGSFPQLADAEDDPEFSVRRFAYQSRGFLAEMQAILRVLDELSGDGGRHSILARLHAGSLAITEQQLRYRLKILQSDGMIKVGRGRQGSSITAKGREFLRFLDTHR